MRIVRRINFVYTLYELDDGAFVLDLVIAAAQNAWANYEKRVILGTREKFLIRLFPRRADQLARRLIAEEKRRQQTDD